MPETIAIDSWRLASAHVGFRTLTPPRRGAGRVQINKKTPGLTAGGEGTQGVSTDESDHGEVIVTR